jgi:LPS export ABC transporter protein LptC
MNWRALLAIIGLVAACLACMAALERVSQALRERHPVPLPAFDYVLSRVQLTRHRTSGPGVVTVDAEHVIHHRVSEQLEVRNPVLQRLGIPEDEMKATAAMATVHKGNDQVDLSGGVRLERAGAEQTLVLTTEKLVVMIDPQTATTDAPVEITQGASILRGRGLKADLRAANFSILSNLQATYVPVPRGKKPELPNVAAITARPVAAGRTVAAVGGRAED